MPDGSGINQGAIDWTPYLNGGEAAYCLTRFTNAALSPDIGIVWCSSNACTLIRKPKLDQDGYGFSVIMRWHPVPPPPPPPVKKSFWQKAETIFWNAMEQSGEAQLAESQADLAMGQALLDLLSQPKTEHKLGLGFDLLALAGFGMLFIPGLGEAEMAFFALSRLAQLTAVAAASGASCATIVDGNYLRLLYFGDGTAQQRADSAEGWEKSDTATTLSVAALILALPDFAVGGVATFRDLTDGLPEDISAATKSAAADRSHAAGALKKAEKISPGNQVKITRLKERAAALTKRADEAAKRAKMLRIKFYATLMLNAPSTALGTPEAVAYFAHDDLRDNPHDLTDPFKTAGRTLGAGTVDLAHWVGRLLTPPSAANGRKIPAGSFSGDIGTNTQQAAR
jgi:hypothetical protein